MRQEDFPKFVCICELCNCGRHKLHRGCRKNNEKVRIDWGSDNTRATHYSSTFTWPHENKQCSCKRTQVILGLPQINRQKCYQVTPRQPNHNSGTVCKPSKDPTDTMAFYPETTTIKFPVNIPQKALSHDHSTCEKCKHPKMSLKSSSFPMLGELPAIVGSLLYPDEREKMETTTMREFFPKPGDKPKKQMHNLQCNLKLEGQREWMTTHCKEFKPYPPEGAVVVKKQSEPTSEEKHKGAPLESLTKYRCDFPLQEHFPKRRKPAKPPLDNLAINTALRSEFRTVQMDTYPGWDTTRHHRPDPVKLRDELSIRDQNADFQDTVTKTDFLPLPLECSHPRVLKAQTSTLKLHQGPFNDQTVNKEFFKVWGVNRRVRYGDPYDKPYVKPLGKFESETTNLQTFTQKRTERVRNYKPLHETVADQGEYDFTTVHREVYRPPTLPVCQLQLYLAQNPPIKECVLPSDSQT